MRQLVNGKRPDLAHVACFTSTSHNVKICIEALAELTVPDTKIHIEVIEFITNFYCHSFSNGIERLSCSASMALFNSEFDKTNEEVEANLPEIRQKLESLKSNPRDMMCPLLYRDHYLLIVLNIPENNMIFFDSLKHRYSKIYYARIKENFDQFADNLNISFDTFKIVSPKCERQRGLDNCGIHLIENLKEYMSKGTVPSQKINNYIKLREIYAHIILDNGRPSINCIYCPDTVTDKDLLMCSTCERHFHKKCNNVITCIVCDMINNNF